jgi:hypothetical protein
MLFGTKRASAAVAPTSFGYQLQVRYTLDAGLPLALYADTNFFA